VSDASLIANHRIVQHAAKAVLELLRTKIATTDTEASIAASAHAELCRLGFPDTWYHACPALVLLGSRSCASLSGRDYAPTDELVGAHNLVTVDLSPVRNGYWGDCARSFYVENGAVVDTPSSTDFAEGKRFLETLHTDMIAFVTPQTSFGQLFHWANERIKAGGFENLDFLGNVGHSIATQRQGRQYIEAGNAGRLSDVPLFTFEPHIRKVGGRWGFKHENIFFFDPHGRLEEL
jgi:Xaa-Pro aminopeptidase